MNLVLSVKDLETLVQIWTQDSWIGNCQDFVVGLIFKSCFSTLISCFKSLSKAVVDFETAVLVFISAVLDLES